MSSSREFFHFTPAKATVTSSAVQNHIISDLRPRRDTALANFRAGLQGKNISDFDPNIPYSVEGSYVHSLQTHLGKLYERGFVAALEYSEYSGITQWGDVYMQMNGIIGVDRIIR